MEKTHFSSNIINKNKLHRSIATYKKVLIIVPRRSDHNKYIHSHIIEYYNIYDHISYIGTNLRQCSDTRKKLTNENIGKNVFITSYRSFELEENLPDSIEKSNILYLNDILYINNDIITKLISLDCNIVAISTIPYVVDNNIIKLFIENGFAIIKAPLKKFFCI